MIGLLKNSIWTFSFVYDCPSWSHPCYKCCLTRGAAAASVRAVVRAPSVAVMSLVVGDGGWHRTVTSSVAVCW